MSRSIPLWLDHASVLVPDLAEAVEHLDRRLGLRVTVSPAAPDRHGRLYLDRGYLEVSARPGGTGWDASLFFLRFEDPASLREHLAGVGLRFRLEDYEGVDGTWDDVEIDAGGVPLPILIRRTAPLEIAADWPPALSQPHRSGARTLVQVHVGVPSIGPATREYTRLLGLGAPPEPVLETRSGRLRAPLPTSSGSVVLLDGGSGTIERLVLGVGSLPRTRDALGAGLVGPEVDEAGIAWVDRSEAFGLELGFVEVDPDPTPVAG